MNAQISSTQIGMEMMRLQKNPFEKDELLFSSISYAPILKIVIQYLPVNLYV